MRALVLFIILSSSSSVFAWSEHHLITAAALSSVASLKAKEVTFTSFDKVAVALGYSNQLDFDTKNQIRKDFVFDTKLGEVPGAPVALLDVLAKYSDEPDWNMDIELFGADQYPELWRSAYKYMGDRLGVPSQSFRHMYWEKISVPHFITTFKIPNPFVDVGQAPDRAALFIDLARKAKAKGFDYWAARFVADALHYLEDVAQPYHSTQVQTKTFMLTPFNPRYNFGFKDYSLNAAKNYVTKVTHVVTYYHFAFEDYVAFAMVDADHQNAQEAQSFHDALSSAPKKKNKSLNSAYDKKNIAALVKAMSGYSAIKAQVLPEPLKNSFPILAVICRKIKFI